jgi:hypothetical protein
MKLINGILKRNLGLGEDRFLEMLNQKPLE